MGSWDVAASLSCGEEIAMNSRYVIRRFQQDVVPVGINRFRGKGLMLGHPQHEQLGLTSSPLHGTGLLAVFW